MELVGASGGCDGRGAWDRSGDGVGACWRGGPVSASAPARPRRSRRSRMKCNGWGVRRWPCRATWPMQHRCRRSRTGPWRRWAGADILVNNAGGGQEKNHGGRRRRGPLAADRRGQSHRPLPGDARVSAAHQRQRWGEGHQHRIGHGARAGARQLPPMRWRKQGCGCSRRCWRGRFGSRAWRSTRSFPGRLPRG